MRSLLLFLLLTVATTAHAGESGYVFTALVNNMGDAAYEIGFADSCEVNAFDEQVRYMHLYCSYDRMVGMLPEYEPEWLTDDQQSGADHNWRIKLTVVIVGYPAEKVFGNCTLNAIRPDIAGVGIFRITANCDPARVFADTFED